MPRLIVRTSLSLLLLAFLAGCTTHQAYRQGEVASQLGNYDDAVLHYMKAANEDPSNLSYKAALIRAKIKASQFHFEKGQEFEKAGVVERALVEYQQAVQLDATNQYAKAQLEHVHRLYLAQRANKGGYETIEQLKQKNRGLRPQPPVLNPRSNQPISLEFPQPVSMFSIYRALGKAFGINILFDPNLRDQEIGLELKDVTAQAALETMMRTAGHFYKVMDEHSIIIAQDTPQNRRTYEDLVIQTFFLSNADVKETLTILRSLIDARKIAVNDQLNAIILRDTVDKVKVAERIIESNDKAKAEVVVDVELLQINSGRLRELGTALSSYSVSQSLNFGQTNTSTTDGTAAAPSGVRLSDLQFINQSNWLLTIPSFVYNFIKTNTDAQLLAKPQLRISEGEKASLVIGDRIPIPLTTFNTQNAGGNGGIVPITSFQYQDVGIRIDMEPRVHHNQEVTLKIKVEVSNLNGNVAGSGGQSQPIIGTRTIDSTIRLQDGETNFLAGLIRSDLTDSDQGIPGLSDIPIIGRLFSNKHTENQRTDVILTLTPHIIRNAEITEEDLQPIWVGTEANISFRGGSPRVESDVEGPFDSSEGTPEEIQDAIRRRLERLPRGLRPGEQPGAPAVQQQPGTFVQPGAPGGQPVQQQPPGGVNLVPAAPPQDIFRPAPPPGQPQPNQVAPPPQAPEDEQPPGGGLVSQRSASDTARLSSAVAPAVTQTSATAGSTVLAAANTLANIPANIPAVRLWLTPGKLTVSPGDTFEVRVQADAGLAVSHLPLSLSFDPAVLSVEAVDPGDFLGAVGESQVLSDTGRPGALVIGASRLGQRPGVKGSGVVARITFRAVAAGRTDLGFEAKALDAGLHPVPVRSRAAIIQVNGEAGPPPHPAPRPREASPVGSR
ncbi:MAG TPA: cohesin domain-containing protein [Thermoanaerobaculia bacterium]|jgi:general secretion pathway protein D|nr:cohesin domain-containing protein [Thermoanaerobaculia bacterium]